MIIINLSKINLVIMVVIVVVFRLFSMLLSFPTH
jgi:hypothetical protein